GEGRIAINGIIPPDGLADLSVQATDFDLADVRRISAAAPPLMGRVNLDALLTGPVADPDLTLRAQVDDLTYEGVTTERLTLDALYGDQRFTGTAQGIMAGVEMFAADLSIPMNLSLDEMIPSFELLATEPLEMTLVADSLPLSLLAAAVPGLVDGAGAARARVQIGGTIESPAMDGTLQLANGAFTSEAPRARYSNTAADLVFAENRITINNLSAVSGGSLTGRGTIDFVQGGDPIVSLNAVLDDFLAINNPDVAEMTVSGELALNGPLSEPVATGRVRISESTFQVPELATQQPGLDLAYADVTQLAPTPVELGAAPPLGNIRVDGVQVGIEESVWLESDELRVQITGEVVLYRTGEDLRVFGSLQAVRGTYALEVSAIVREFDVISGRVQFFGTGDLNPSLDILAGYRVRGSTVG